MSHYKPANYSTVSPYLVVNDANATIDFLKKVFGAIELRRFPDEAGRLMHAEVRIVKLRASPRRVPPGPAYSTDPRERPRPSWDTAPPRPEGWSPPRSPRSGMASGASSPRRFDASWTRPGPCGPSRATS